MKRAIAILLSALMLASLLAVSAGARGYTLSLPKDMDQHNLEAYGLHTMNVYRYDDYFENPEDNAAAPVIDGIITSGEYPGPNDGCVSSNTVGDGLWIGSHGNGNVNSYTGREDWTTLVDPADYPPYLNMYMTYDDDFVYIAIDTVFNAPANAAPDTGGTFVLDIRNNFMQTSDFPANYSQNWTRYNISKTVPSAKYTMEDNSLLPHAVPYSVVIYSSDNGSSTTTGRIIRQFDQEQKKWVQITLPYAYDSAGTRLDNDYYKNCAHYTVEVLNVENDSGEAVQMWHLQFECKQPLADVLRITDVEYDDGSPLDYVPEWGAIGVNIRYRALHETTDVELNRRLYIQTMLPTGGVGYTAANSTISGVLFSNTMNAASSNTFGIATNHVLCPVHFLGYYDAEVDYEDTYYQPVNTVAKLTTRVTRTRTPVLTSGVRGVNGRVVAVATNASDRTPDDLPIVLVTAGVVLLMAASAAAIFFMKKRARER